MIRQLLMGVLVTLMAISSGYAQEQSDGVPKDIRKTVLREIRKRLGHPGFPDGGRKAEVIVAVRVSDTGQLEIDQLSATHQELVPVVETCLGKIRIDGVVKGTKELLYYRLRFRSAG